MDASMQPAYEAALKNAELHKERADYFKRKAEHIAAGGSLCGWCNAPFVAVDHGDGWERCSDCGGN